MIREWIAHVIILYSKDIRSFIDPSSVNLIRIIKFRLPQADVHVEVCEQSSCFNRTAKSFELTYRILNAFSQKKG